MRREVRNETTRSERATASPASGMEGGLSRVLSSLKSERGQALVEFAFIGPLLLFFILIVVDFGIAMDRRELVQHAVREGARRAAVTYGLPRKGAVPAHRVPVVVCQVRWAQVQATQAVVASSQAPNRVARTKKIPISSSWRSTVSPRSTNGSRPSRPPRKAVRRERPACR